MAGDWWLGIQRKELGFMRIVLTVLCILILSFGFATGGTWGSGAGTGSAGTGDAGASSKDYPAPGEVAAESSQDTVYLDRRISTLESRLGSIESNLRSLQQQAMASERSTAAQPTRDPEVTLLRSEVEILSSRLRELECALARLDERTLAPAAREARKRTAPQSNDPCRVNPDAPIQLSPRR